MKPRIILATVGTLGDLHPFIALGLALQARGGDVVLASAAEYREKVEGAGLVFRTIRPSFEDMQTALGMTRAQLTHAVVARADFLFRRLIMPHLRESYEDMLAVIDGADVIVTSSLAFGARLAAERRTIPWISVVLQPFMFLSAFDPPVLPGFAWLNAPLRRLGPAPTRWMLKLGKRAVGLLLRPVRALRGEIGLAPSRLDPLFDGQFSTVATIGLYSSVLGEAQPDHPVGTHIVGFPRFDGHAAVLEDSLDEFLGVGPAPVVFTLGSLIVNSPGSFYAQSVAAAKALGTRAVLLVGDAGRTALSGLQSADVHVCAYAAHSLLFPRALAIVHQGGIGTLAEALRAGVVQLIVPFYADQEDNAARAGKLGVARWLAPGRYTAASAARELAALLRVPDFGSRAIAVKQQLSAEDGAARAADIVWDRLDLHQKSNGEVR